MGILDKIKEGLDTLKGAEWKTTSDYEKSGGPKLPKKVVKKTTVVEAVPEDDLPAMNDKGEYIKPRPYKKGGSTKSCKCMARGGGCEVRGKTRGRFV